MAYENHWLPGCFNVEEWFDGDRYETLAIRRTLEPARAAFAFAVAEKPAARGLSPKKSLGKVGPRRGQGRE
jgi:hypothetical protein